MIITDRNSSAATEVGANPAFRWSMLFVGLAVGFLGMDIMVRRPMVRELSQVRSELKAVENDMHELVGQRNHVWETNNLLTSLKSQYRAFEEARVSLSAMQLLRKEIETESGKTSAALASLDRLVGVQNVVLKNTQNVTVAEGSLQRMVAMQQQVVEASGFADEAVAAIDGLVKIRNAATSEAKELDSAFAAVTELGKLKTQVIESGRQVEIAQTDVDAAFNNVRRLGDLKTLILNNGEGLDAAGDHLVAFIALKNDIFSEAGNVDVARDTARTLIDINTDLYNEFENALVAQSSATDLIRLRDTILTDAADTKTAFANTNNLLTLRDTLNGDLNLVAAQRNLDSLVTIEESLNAQTKQIVGAIDTLEVLTDLGDELQAQVKAMGDMRKSLMDIVLMEATVSRVAKIIEPLGELTNLRRMSDDDVREAARTIMDSRASRTAARRVPQRSTADESLKLDDIDLFENEQPRDILVPAPRDEDIDRVLEGLK